MRCVILSVLLVLVGCGDSASPAGATDTDGPGARSLDEAVAQADSATFPLGLGQAAPHTPPVAAHEASRQTVRPLEGESPTRERRAQQEAPQDGRYALLIGVSDYPGTRDDLPSGDYDVAAMRALLVEHFGFRPDHILTLTDRDATRGAFQEAIARHLGQAQTTALLYVSSHGVRLESNVGRADPEPEGRDEALYLWADDRASGALVLDDEIGVWTDALGAQRVLVVLDACHSGTGARGVAAATPPVKEVALDSVRSALDPAAPWARSDATPDPPTTLPRQTILLSAARDREPAYAGHPGEPSLFTATFVRLAGAAPLNASLGDVMDAVQAYVEAVSTRYGSAHSPQYDGGNSLTLADLFGPGQ